MLYCFVTPFFSSDNILRMISQENDYFLFLLSLKAVYAVLFCATRKVIQCWNSHNFVKYVCSL